MGILWGISICCGGHVSVWQLSSTVRLVSLFAFCQLKMARNLRYNLREAVELVQDSGSDLDISSDEEDWPSEGS